MSDKESMVRLQSVRSLVAGAGMLAVMLAWLVALPPAEQVSAHGRKAAGTIRVEGAKAAISISYPEDGSIFPPGITPPTFIWGDASSASKSWRIRIGFGDGAQAVEAVSHGERMQIGPIDPTCEGPTNKLPSLTPEQAASWVWKPDAATWAEIQKHSAGAPATMTITGYDAGGAVASRGRTRFTTSRDPVGAPIFYRDVPLMPAGGKEGIVQPLAADKVKLIHWRLRDITRPDSRIVIKSVPTCMNCHSFSLDGKAMGIDVDGPANDKGMYAVVPISKHIVIANKDVVHWNTDGEVGTTRVGFMSQVSPNGQYVVSTFAGPSLDVPKSYYVTNFTDYRFLQVFYPTRGILEWYSRTTGKRNPLPGADDPRYVQTDGVWSPDGKWVVFARALALEPDDARVQSDIAANLFLSGHADEALEHIRKAVELNPEIAQSHYYLGAFLLEQGHPDQAVPELQEALRIYARYPSGESTLGEAYMMMGRDAEALEHLQRAIAQDPSQTISLVDAARILSSSRNAALRNGAEAVKLATQANQMTKGTDPDVLDALGAAYAEAGQFQQALEAANHALKLVEASGNAAQAQLIRNRIGLYQAGAPFRE